MNILMENQESAVKPISELDFNATNGTLKGHGST
jgi:hypothetical protein